jgi:hypothetical protein
MNTQAFLFIDRAGHEITGLQYARDRQRSQRRVDQGNRRCDWWHGECCAGYTQALAARGNTLLLVSVSAAVHEQLAETGFLDMLDADNVFVASKPGESTARAFQRAQKNYATTRLLKR